ncbi:hypothetical protein DFJ74DRAFT_729183 [Hyaloraphidium curvatum]|nr:hypothetical protein DFJ74DRAFT_729183 [Hyaloraphidium curvatum]
MPRRFRDLSADEAYYALISRDPLNPELAGAAASLRQSFTGAQIADQIALSPQLFFQGWFQATRDGSRAANEVLQAVYASYPDGRLVAPAPPPPPPPAPATQVAPGPQQQHQAPPVFALAPAVTVAVGPGPAAHADQPAAYTLPGKGPAASGADGLALGNVEDIAELLQGDDLPAAPAKRGPGRPRKNPVPPQQAEVRPPEPRGPGGRAKVAKAPPATPAPLAGTKHGQGSETLPLPALMHVGSGDERADALYADDRAPAAKRPRGRPPKNAAPAPEPASGPKAAPGNGSKEVEAQPKRKVGRPPKPKPAPPASPTDKPASPIDKPASPIDQPTPHSAAGVLTNASGIPRLRSTSPSLHGDELQAPPPYPHTRTRRTKPEPILGTGGARLAPAQETPAGRTRSKAGGAHEEEETEPARPTVRRQAGRAVEASPAAPRHPPLPIRLNIPQGGRVSSEGPIEQLSEAGEQGSGGVGRHGGVSDEVEDSEQDGEFEGEGGEGDDDDEDEEEPEVDADDSSEDEYEPTARGGGRRRGRPAKGARRSASLEI